MTFWTTFTHEPNRSTQVEAYTRYVSSSTYLTQHLLGSILAIFGVMALGAYLANGRRGRLALTAMIMCVAGNALNLPYSASPRSSHPLSGGSTWRDSPALCK